MHSVQSVKDFIRKPLPLLFGGPTAADSTDFIAKFNGLVAYARAISEPVLTSDSIRYQSLLLKLALVLASISLLRLNSVKIFDSIVTVDPLLLVIYAGFVVIVGTVFIVKASIDYQRVTFTRELNAEASVDVRRLVEVWLLRKQVQLYFWLEIFDLIGLKYKLYADALGAARNRASDFTPIPVQAMTLNLAELRAVPELADDISELQQFLSTLNFELNGDADRFERDVKRLNANIRDEQDDQSSEWPEMRLYSGVEEVFGRTLKIWFDARNELGDEVLETAIENRVEINRLEAVKTILDRVRNIQKLYIGLEVIAPVCMALFSVAYVIWREIS